MRAIGLLYHEGQEEMTLVIETLEGNKDRYLMRRPDFIKLTKTLVEWVFLDPGLKSELIEAVNVRGGNGNGLVDRGDRSPPWGDPR